MKQELDQKSIDALSQYRIQRAKETILEAEMLMQKDSLTLLLIACIMLVTIL